MLPHAESIGDKETINEHVEGTAQFSRDPCDNIAKCSRRMPRKGFVAGSIFHCPGNTATGTSGQRGEAF